MPTLLETQRAFMDAVLGAGDIDLEGAPIAGAIFENGIPAAERLQIYRNNTLILLAEALAETFPTVAKLVGSEFFDAMAKAFIRAHPPAQPSLIAYGDAFAGFIDGFDPASGLPYLGDVARLEWAWLEAYHAMDANPLDPASLTSAPPERMGDLTFRLHPSARFASSPYPTVAIWEANQDDADNEVAVSLDDGPTHVLIVRPAIEVEMRSLTPAAFAFFQRLAEGSTVSKALEGATATDPGFTLEVVLGLAIADGTLTEAFLDGQSLAPAA